MPTKKPAEQPLDLAEALLVAHSTNDRINQYLIEHLPPAAWDLKPPGGKGRSIAATFAHIHNVRLMWLKSAGWTGALPEKMDGGVVSKEQAAKALQASNDAMHNLVAEALAGTGKIKGFKPDVCSFLAYLFAHDGHHRGQISMLARQLGHPLPQGVMYGLWEWGTR